MPSAIVTGSSRGIGRAVALQFARDGYDVAVNYVKSAQKAQTVAETINQETNSEAVVVRADVSVPDAAEYLVETAVETFGGLDHVVNNAGIDQHKYTEDLSYDDFDRIMNVNVNSAFQVSKVAQPYLKKSDEPAKPSITNMSSILAHTGAAVECHYAASKSALIGLTKSHARDFAPEIRVNAVAPGHIETDMTADRTEEEKKREIEEIPLERYGQPADIADAAAYLRDARFVTGETLNVNGGELMV
ncbi:MAG: glucose 1-dehydrogenase [Halobacteria archaeon]|nr:glucose 1-dehydrogenase [Halobacteria archaeon]